MPGSGLLHLAGEHPFCRALCSDHCGGTCSLAGAGSGPESACVVLQGVSAVAVTSGANMNFDRLRLVTELAGIGGLQEAMLATTMPERQGSFRDFVDIALDNPGLQITEFKYRYGSSLPWNREPDCALWRALLRVKAAQGHPQELL